MNRHDDGFAAVDAYEVAEAHWPCDGPYEPELTTAAAEMIERLVRYLNNATAKPPALACAATAGSVLASLHAAVFGLGQLVGQLAHFAVEQAGDPTLYDDRRDRSERLTALLLATELGEVGMAVRGLVDPLGRAAGTASHLGNDR